MQLSVAGEQKLLKAAKELSLDLEQHLSYFQRLFESLTEANQSLNLTAIEDENAIIYKHFIDSLTCTKVDELLKTKTVMDVGTGAGFPGLPLAILQPETRFVLVDGTKKKIEYLEATIRRLALNNVVARWGRAEELAKEAQYREQFDAVVTRAVSSMAVLAELCLPFVRVGGLVVVQKAGEVEKEVKQAQRAIDLMGGETEQAIALELPHVHDPRTLVTLRKISSTPKQYPRRAGVPAKNPLF